MNGIFPSVEEIEGELDRLRVERESLDAAIAERQLFVELGRRLAVQRRGLGIAPAPAPAATAERPAPAPRAVAERAVSAVPDPWPAAEPAPAASAIPAPASGPADQALTPRIVARARGRELVGEAVAILRAQGRPMHAAELVPLLADRGHTLPGHDPVAALNTRLWKRARTGRYVVRHGDAVYAAGEGPGDGAG